MSFIKVNKCSTFNIHDPTSIRILTRLRLDVSQLNEHKLGRDFRNTVSPICAFGSELNCKGHFHLRCPVFTVEKNHLFKSLNNIKLPILNILTYFLLFGLGR